ncbi:TPA: glycosyltransferase, partial [Citrobacter braakii]|nr:glycosyltransferase [Citrobacter braakii]
CVVLPSFYREGTPKSLIEAAALGKIIVTTNNIGCKDTVIDDVTGYLCEPKSTKSLVQMLEKVMLLDNSKMLQMCKASRQLAVNKFDERIIINKYFEEIES